MSKKEGELVTITIINIRGLVLLNPNLNKSVEYLSFLWKHVVVERDVFVAADLFEVALEVDAKAAPTAFFRYRQAATNLQLNFQLYAVLKNI